MLETDKYKYLGMVVNTEGNLKDHMQELGQKKKKSKNATGAEKSGRNRRNCSEAKAVWIMTDACNVALTSSMEKDTDKRTRWNRDNAKQSTQTVTASPNIKVNQLQEY